MHKPYVTMTHLEMIMTLDAAITVLIDHPNNGIVTDIRDRVNYYIDEANKTKLFGKYVKAQQVALLKLAKHPKIIGY